VTQVPRISRVSLTADALAGATKQRVEGDVKSDSERLQQECCAKGSAASD